MQHSAAEGFFKMRSSDLASSSRGSSGIAASSSGGIAQAAPGSIFARGAHLQSPPGRKVLIRSASPTSDSLPLFLLLSFSSCSSSVYSSSKIREPRQTRSSCRSIFNHGSSPPLVPLLLLVLFTRSSGACDPFANAGIRFESLRVCVCMCARAFFFCVLRLFSSFDIQIFFAVTPADMLISVCNKRYWDMMIYIFVYCFVILLFDN